jgi:hypothetical protein
LKGLEWHEAGGVQPHLKSPQLMVFSFSIFDLREGIKYENANHSFRITSKFVPHNDSPVDT